MNTKVKVRDRALMSDAEFLRSLAENDYMIDQHMLPDGKRLSEIAGRIEEGDAFYE